MSRTNFTTDVRPVTDFKAHGSEIVTQAQTSRRPIVVTRRGRAAAVLLDVGEFERMQEEIDLGRALDAGAAQAAAGEFAEEVAVRATLARLEK